MLIALSCLASNMMLLQIKEYSLALVEPIVAVVLTFAGIVLLFSALGIRISNNLGATVVGGIFRAIGYIGRAAIRLIIWVIRNLFIVIPLVFRGSRRMFLELGMNNLVANVLAALLVVAII